MNWEAAGAVGEIFGALIVAATLVYLAAQTRLYRRAMEADAVSKVTSNFNNVHELLIQSEDAAILNEKGHRDPDSLTRGEKLRYFMMVRQTINAYFEMFTQHRAGDIDKQTWEVVRFDIYASQPGVRRFLKDQESTYPKDFVEYYNSLEVLTDPDPVFLMTGGSINDQ